MLDLELLPPTLASALAARGFETLTPVQEAVLAPDLAGSDLIVSAQTGSGKTVAFGLALAHELLAGAERFAGAGDPMALIIAPTRELALQVQRELAWLYEHTGARVVSCVGGMDPREERRALERGAHIVVGTPGRLADHIRRGALVLEGLKAAVLDEADEMLNLGFREELEFILQASPAERRTLMFSATIPRGIEALARAYQRDAKRVNTVGGSKQHADIEYRALVTASHEAENAIFNVLRFYDATNAIVFCSTREGVNRMMSRLSNRGIEVVALSGELSQNQRTHALQAMRDHRAQVCVATDVAARGIDLPDLDLVIHADLPKNTEGLLHRSGRTGRAGRKGASILIVPVNARRRLERLLREGGVQAEWGAPPSADDVKRRDDERLLSDPALTSPLDDTERRLVEQLLAAHDPVQIAAAFIRMARKDMSAPEDLQPMAVDHPARNERAYPGEREHREDRRERAPGIWLRLSVGRAQQADPRWLIPMLCKAGGCTKRDIGTIRIEEDETMVELAPHAAHQILGSAGPDGRLEKAVFVAPAGFDPAYSRPSRAPGPSGPRPGPKSGKPPGKPAGKPAAKLQGKPLRSKTPTSDKPSRAERKQHKAKLPE